MNIRTIVGILATICILIAWMFVSGPLWDKKDDGPVWVALAGMAVAILVAGVLFAVWHTVMKG